MANLKGMKQLIKVQYICHKNAISSAYCIQAHTLGQ